MRSLADEDADTDAECDRRDGIDAEAFERERRGGFRFFALGVRPRFDGDARGVRRLLVLHPFAFRAVGFAGVLIERGGGAVDRFWLTRIPVPEADIEDEADEPRLGLDDTDVSLSLLDSDVPEESKWVIADIWCVLGVGGVQGRT